MAKVKHKGLFAKRSGALTSEGRRVSMMVAQALKKFFDKKIDKRELELLIINEATYLGSISRSTKIKKV